MGITQQVLSEAQGARNIPLLIQVRLFHWGAAAPSSRDSSKKHRTILWWAWAVQSVTPALNSHSAPQHRGTALALCGDSSRITRPAQGPSSPSCPKHWEDTEFWSPHPCSETGAQSADVQCTALAISRQGNPRQTETFQSPPVPALAAPCAIITHRSPLVPGMMSLAAAVPVSDHPAGLTCSLTQPSVGTGPTWRSQKDFCFLYIFHIFCRDCRLLLYSYIAP